MSLTHSKRARILQQVLHFINNDDWEDRRGEGFLIFGKEAFESWLDDPGHSRDTTEDEKLRALVTKLKVNQGTRDVARKITLGNLPPDSTVNDLLDWFSSLHTSKREQIIEQLKQ